MTFTLQFSPTISIWPFFFPDNIWLCLVLLRKKNYGKQKEFFLFECLIKNIKKIKYKQNYL